MKDEELMLQLAVGKVDAADILVTRYKDILFGFLYRLTVNRSDAEDLFQETWLRVVRYGHSYLPGKKFSSWLFQIAINCTRDLLKNRHTPATSSEGVSCLDTGIQQVEDRELAGMLMQRLPLDQREILVLRYFHSMKETEIASLLNIPLGTVKSRQHKALQYLRNYYGNEHARIMDG